MKKKLLLFIGSLLINMSAWSADGDVFTANTIEGITMTFKVISEANKECQVGMGGYGNSSISKSTSGTVTIPSQVNGYNVVHLGSSAFNNCSNLATIVIPNSITSIDEYVFEYCSSLQSIDIPNNVTSIGYWAFAGCSVLSSINIPSSVTSIGEGAFAECSGLLSITVDGGNSKYDSRNDCNAIIDSSTNELIRGCKNSFIPNTVKSIGYGAFSGCSELTSITIPNGVTSIGDGAFNFCSGLTTITIPNSVTSIGMAAFEGCSGLTTITNSNNVKIIGNHAFNGCEKITSIMLPNTLTTIDDNAFQDCCKLESIIIPINVTYIGYQSFCGCNELTNVTVKWNTPLVISSYIFEDPGIITLNVPTGRVGTYLATDVWKDFKEIEEITSEDFTMSANKIGTFCSTSSLDFTSVTGLKAYIASGFSPSTGELLLTRVNKVPAGEGLLLKGDADDYVIPCTTTDMVYSNLLKGVTTATTISPTDGDYTNFILANGTHGIGFYTLSASGQIAAGKAYLQLPTSELTSLSRGLTFVFDDETDVTGIKSVSDSKNHGTMIYDLQGRQVTKLNKGLYIENGKKVYIK